jgi:hypothetical protein
MDSAIDSRKLDGYDFYDFVGGEVEMDRVSLFGM